jgi:DNA-binding GntR family transcriptional regulator
MRKRTDRAVRGEGEASGTLLGNAPVLARITETLGGWIQDGTLAPGEALEERKLGARLGTGHTTVREALLLLADQGLAVPRSEGGFRTAPLAREEGEDLFRLLGELESRALLRSGPRRALELARLEELDAARLDATDAPSRLAMDRRWHHHLLPARRIGRVARGELDRLEVQITRYQLALLGDHPDDWSIVGPVLEHRGIVDALLRDRLREAARRLEEHWVRGAGRVVSGWPLPGADGTTTSPAAA